MEKIIVLGSGGHAKSVIDSICATGKYEIIGIVSHDNKKVMDYPILGDDSVLKKIYDSGIKNVAIGIGYMGCGNLRERLYFKLKEIGYQLPVVVDPTACVANSTVLGEGTFVGKGAVVNAESQIGILGIINTSAVIEHESVIEDYTHVAVAAVVCGNVHIGKKCMIGANSTIIQGTNIVEHTIIGAGSTVVKDIDISGIYVGSPARRVKNV